MTRARPASKRPQGRTPRSDDPTRLVVRIPSELKRWLAHRAIDEGRDMAQLTAEALEEYRRRVKRLP